MTPANNMDEARKLIRKFRVYATHTSLFDHGDHRRNALEDIRAIDAFLSKTNLEEAPSNSAFADEKAFHEFCSDVWKRITQHHSQHPDAGEITVPTANDGGANPHAVSALEKLANWREGPLTGSPAPGASTSLKEEQREVMCNDPTKGRNAEAQGKHEGHSVVPPPKSEPLAMRVCPNPGCGKFYKGKVAVIMGDKSFADCPICKGKGQVPVIPPASTLREIYAQYYSSKGIDPVNSGCTWHDDALEAVASAVSLRCKEEIEGHHVSMEVMRKEIVAQQMEIARLTTLANENAVLAVEREAENARKDAVIEEARGVIIGYFELIKHQKSKEEHLEHVRSVLARLAQKGKS